MQSAGAQNFLTPSQGAVNMAPLEPLRQLKHREERAYECSSLAQFVRELHMEVKNRSVDERREIAETGRLMANVRSGKLVIKRDPIYGGLALLKPLPHKPRSDRHVYPLAQVNSSQLTSIWTLSRPRAITRHFGTSNRSQIQHALVDSVIQHYDAELFDELFHQRESLSMMDYGTSIVRVFYDRHINQIRQIQPVIEQQDQTLFDGYGFCPQCGYEGTDQDFTPRQGELLPSCPECRNYNVSDLTPATTVQMPTVVGQREIVQGDIGAELLPVPACNWDMRKLAHESSYFAYRSEVPLKLVQSILGCDVEEASPDQDMGLEILNAIGSRGGSAENFGRENLEGHSTRQRGMAIMDEEYFEPEWYTGVKLKKEERTVGGDVIPANTPLEEVFPDGLCVVGFNDMAIQAGVWNEKRRVIGGVYHIQSHSGVGKGTQDTIEIAEQLNMAHSANLAMLKRYGAGGGYWYDKDVMTQKEAKALLKPGGLVGVSMRGTNYSSVEAALQQIRHGELSNSNLTMVAQLANMMNIAFQTTEFTQGVANDQVNVNTATGQQMLMAQNQQRSAAPLRMKGYMRARIFEHVVELFRDNIQIPKVFGAGDKFSVTKSRMVSGADMPAKVRCDFVQDSEQPTNTYTKRENAKAMLEASQYFGIPFAQLAAIDPRRAAWWASQFQVDLPGFNYSELLLVCQDRIDDLKQQSAEIEQVLQASGAALPPEVVAEQMVNQIKRPLSVFEENHQIKAQLTSEYLDDDEAAEWSPYLRSAVQALIARHYQMDEQARAFVAGLANQTQIGLAMQQQQAMQPAIDAQNQAAAQQELMARGADAIQAEEDHQRQQEAADNDFRRQQMLSDRQHAQERAAAEEDHTRNFEMKKYELKHKPKPSPGKRK